MHSDHKTKLKHSHRARKFSSENVAKRKTHLKSFIPKFLFHNVNKKTNKRNALNNCNVFMVVRWK